jgi:hypothetical protein
MTNGVYKKDEKKKKKPRESDTEAQGKTFRPSAKMDNQTSQPVDGHEMRERFPLTIYRFLAMGSTGKQGRGVSLR